MNDWPEIDNAFLELAAIPDPRNASHKVALLELLLRILGQLSWPLSKSSRQAASVLALNRRRLDAIEKPRLLSNSRVGQHISLPVDAKATSVCKNKRGMGAGTWKRLLRLGYQGGWQLVHVLLGYTNLFCTAYMHSCPSLLILTGMRALSRDHHNAFPRRIDSENERQGILSQIGNIAARRRLCPTHIRFSFPRRSRSTV